MFFILSKVLIYFLSPTLWIVLLLVIGLITKKRKLKKFTLITALLLFILFSNTFLLNRFASFWDAKETELPGGKTYSCAIVLGGYGAEDVNGKGYFTGASDRFIQGAKLRAQGKVTHLLISGGNAMLLPTDFRESNWVLTQLKAFNIPDSDILIENQSRNSFENALFSKKILDSVHLDTPYLLVTSAFHMRRALYTYKKMGVDVIPFPCNYIAGKGKTTLADFIPSASALSTWEYYIKEVVGYGVYVITKK